MQLVADLHLHSQYSRAVSKQMTLEFLSQWAKLKGIDLLGTGDFTHPLWFRTLKEGLKEAGEGIYALKREEDKTRFLLTAEIASIYRQGERVRKIHNLVFAPSFQAVEKLNRSLLKKGANLMADGRPIIGLSARELLALVLEADENCLLIPAHIWTPWFSLFGANSGFDSIKECFGNLADRVYAVETGLSSDPAMNWQITELANRQIVSFSDAHSPANLGRELTVFEVKKVSYSQIGEALKGEKSSGSKIAHTLEFYPEEGKYHFTGHRQCGVVQSPEQTAKKGRTCPVCGKPLTIGVMHRVKQLAQEENLSELVVEKDSFGVRWLTQKGRCPYATLVPLAEIISEVKNVGKSSKTVMNEYEKLLQKFGSELTVLTKIKPEEIGLAFGEKLAEGIGRVRAGDIYVKPGFDGVFGKVAVWEKEIENQESLKDQMSLF